MALKDAQRALALGVESPEALLQQVRPVRAVPAKHFLHQEGLAACLAPRRVRYCCCNCCRFYCFLVLLLLLYLLPPVRP